MKKSLTLPSIASFFNSLKDEHDEPIYTYNDEILIFFVRQSNIAVKVDFSIDIINLPFQMKNLILFRKN